MPTKYHIEETPQSVSVELTSYGQLQAGLHRFVGATALCFMLSLFLSFVDIFAARDTLDFYHYFLIFSAMLGVSVLGGSVFGVLRWRARNRWTLDIGKKVAFWEAETATGNSATGSLALEEITGVRLIPPPAPTRAHQLCLLFQNGSQEIIASTRSNPEELRRLQRIIESLLGV